MLTFKEKIDTVALSYIVDNADEYDDLEESSLCTAKGILGKAIQGEITTSYVRSQYQHDGGRLYSSGGLSLQNLFYRIRHAVAKDYYDDIDIVNAHPVILTQMCQSRGIDCPILTKYVQHRTKMLKKMRSDKHTILKILYGSKYEGNNRHLKAFATEATSIRLAFSRDADYADWKREKDWNRKGSYLSSRICDIENDILMCMLQFFQDSKVVDGDCVLVFDGIMIPKPTEDGPTYSLDECELFIKEHMGYDIKLKIKPMEEGYDIPAEIYKDEKYGDVDDVVLPDDMEISYHKTVDKAIGSAHREEPNPWREEGKMATVVEDVAGGHLCELPAEGDILIRAGMGSGKTHQVANILVQYERVVILSMRRSFASNIIGRFNAQGLEFKNYLTYTAEKKKIPLDGRIVIQVESLHHINMENMPQLLIIDESCSIMEQMHSSTMGDNARTCFEVFRCVANVRVKKRKETELSNTNTVTIQVQPENKTVVLK